MRIWSWNRNRSWLFRHTSILDIQHWVFDILLGKRDERTDMRDERSWEVNDELGMLSLKLKSKSIIWIYFKHWLFDMLLGERNYELRIMNAKVEVDHSGILRYWVFNIGCSVFCWVKGERWRDEGKLIMNNDWRLWIFDCWIGSKQSANEYWEVKIQSLKVQKRYFYI